MKRLLPVLMGITVLVLAASGCVNTLSKEELGKKFNPPFGYAYSMGALPYALDRKKKGKPPVMIYAHGGGGYHSSDKKRIGLFKNEGFATLAFDAFKLHGLKNLDVSRNYSLSAKQDMIIAAMKVAYDYVLRRSDWDSERIFLYGHSNGGRAVLCFPSLVKEPHRIKGILAEGAAVQISSLSGCELPDDLVIPTRLFYGKKDNCYGRRDQHTVIFERGSPSMQAWVKSLRNKGRDVDLILYEEAGHGLHSGMLKEKARCYSGGSCSTYYKGATSKAVKLYERDVKAFIDTYSMN